MFLRTCRLLHDDWLLTVYFLLSKEGQEKLCSTQKLLLWLKWEN